MLNQKISFVFDLQRFTDTQFNVATGNTVLSSSAVSLSASQIQAGTLPVARGGTGQTDLSKVTVGTATSANSATTATTAASLTTARALQVSLNKTSATNFQGNANVTNIGVQGVLQIAQGGTGQTTAALARNALGLGNTTGALPVANGGTGTNSLANITVGAATKDGSGNVITSTYVPITLTPAKEGTTTGGDQGVLVPAACTDAVSSMIAGNMQNFATIKSGFYSAIVTVNAAGAAANQWFNVINNKHRNGSGDGHKYGMILYSHLTAVSDLYWRQDCAGTWQTEKKIIDSSNIGSQTVAAAAQCTGNAVTASSLQTARALQVSLSNTAAANFQGNGDVKTIGVQGTLAVANGGTGTNNLANITVGKANTLTTARALQVSLSSTGAPTFNGTADVKTIGVQGILGTVHGGTGAAVNPSMLTNLGSTVAANVFQASPRPGVTGTLPIAHGGTGATTAAAAFQNIKVGHTCVQYQGGTVTNPWFKVASYNMGGTWADSTLVLAVKNCTRHGGSGILVVHIMSNSSKPDGGAIYWLAEHAMHAPSFLLQAPTAVGGEYALWCAVTGAQTGVRFTVIDCSNVRNGKALGWTLYDNLAGGTQAEAPTEGIITESALGGTVANASNVTGVVPIANGGTGQITAAAARNALGLGNTTGALPVANGGTGQTNLNNVKVGETRMVRSSVLNDGMYGNSLDPYPVIYTRMRNEWGGMFVGLGDDTASTSEGGYLDIGTGDNGAEAIYVSQYKNNLSAMPTDGALTKTNVDTLLSTRARRATLLGTDGNTGFPGTVTAAAFSGPLTGNVIGNVTGNVSGSSGSCTGNAATATKATQDGSGHVITSYYTPLLVTPTIAGGSGTTETICNIPSACSNDVNAAINLNMANFNSIKSGMYTCQVSVGASGAASTKPWFNVLNVKHRNSQSDGRGYGMIFYSLMQSDTDLYWRHQFNNAWKTERKIIDSVNVSLQTAGNVVQKYSRSTVGGLDWGTNNGYLIDKSALAYWNGTYNGTTSNLSHCNKGAFGSIVTCNSPLPITNGGTGATVLSAVNVGGATKATQDSDGSQINTTYAKLSGATFTGDIILGQGKRIIAQGSKANYPIITNAHSNASGYGQDVIVSAGQALIMGAGEAPQNVYETVTGAQDSEEAYLVADGNVYIMSNCNSMPNRKVFTFGTNGVLTATGFSGPLTGNVTGNVSGSSGSCTGNAATATKASSLSSARALQVSLSNSSAANFQGNADVKTIGVQGVLPIAHGGTGQTTAAGLYNAIKGIHTCIQYQGGTQKKPWYKVAEITLSSTWNDASITFLVENCVGGDQRGILHIHVSTNATGPNTAQCQWFINSGFNESYFRLQKPSDKANPWILWHYRAGTNAGTRFTVIDCQHSRSGKNIWTLHENLAGGTQDAEPTGTIITSSYTTAALGATKFNGNVTLGDDSNISYIYMPRTGGGIVSEIDANTMSGLLLYDRQSWGHDIIVQGSNRLYVNSGEECKKWLDTGTFPDKLKSDGTWRTLSNSNNQEALVLACDSNMNFFTGMNATDQTARWARMTAYSGYFIANGFCGNLATPVAVCTTPAATAAKTVTIPNYSYNKEDSTAANNTATEHFCDRISVLFVNGNSVTGAITLSINGNAARTILYQGANPGTKIKAKGLYDMIRINTEQTGNAVGTGWHIVGYLA